MTPTGVSHYLVLWEQALDRGDDLPACQLCPDRPHLIDELARCIDALRALRRLASDAPPTRPLDPLAAADDHPPDTVAPTLTGGTASVIDPFPRRTANRFHAVRPIAQGGLGEIHLAMDLELHREVALKEIRGHLADSRPVRARFLFEAEITGKLEHPGVVPVYGLGVYADGRPYYAMRFIKGESLQEAIASFHGLAPRGAFSLGLGLRELLTRFVAVCNTVAYAHSRGIIHRDIKPANVMLGEYGETLVVDWGLAKALNPGTIKHAPEEHHPGHGSAGLTGHETVAGSAVGTPRFMSPEQAAGDPGVGPASDIYSLGATLYFLLTGTAPFEDGDVSLLLARVQAGTFPPPREVRKDLPPALDAICLKAMARRPEDRYPTARDLAADVERWLADEPVLAYPEWWSERLMRWLRRHRAWVASVGAALVLGLVILAVALALVTSAYQEESKAREDAEQSRRRAEEAFRTAREAVDTSFTHLSENTLLNQPGMQPLRKSLLEDALKYYRRFLAERGDDPSVKKEYADAHFREGRILELTSTAAEAMPSYEKALAIQDELTEAGDSSLALLEARGNTLNALGRVRHKMYRHADALNYYEKAAAARRKVADQKPGDAEAGRALASTWMNIGLVYKDRGEPAQAAKYLANAQALRGALREKDRGTPLLRDLAMGDYNLGLLELSRKDDRAAEASFRAALAGFDAVAAAEPNDLNNRFLLSLCCRTLGDLLAVPAREKDSQAMYARARGILEQLADRNPDVPQYRTALAELLLNIGAQHFRAGRLADAASEFARSAAAYESLPEEARESSRSVRDLAVCRRFQGQILAAQGKPGEARKLLERSREGLEGLAKKYPKNPDFTAQLEQTRAALAKLPRE